MIDNSHHQMKQVYLISSLHRVKILVDTFKRFQFSQNSENVISKLNPVHPLNVFKSLFFVSLSIQLHNLFSFVV